MKKPITILFALSFLVVLWATLSGRVINPLATASGSVYAGNIPEGMYAIEGWASHRCLEIPNSACESEVGIQTLDCDRTGTSNNQKFNIVSDGSGNYTISPVHSDLCLEVYGEQAGRIPVLQSVCTPGKISQKWAMSQYGDNLEIRAVQDNQCMEVWNKLKVNYTPVVMQRCNNGTNQRWTLRKTTLNDDKGIICRASPSHPERNCSGVNDQQKAVHLGKTLTKARCEEACNATRMVSCQWENRKQ